MAAVDAFRQDTYAVAQIFEKRDLPYGTSMTLFAGWIKL